jgi:hypothetical protein
MRLRRTCRKASGIAAGILIACPLVAGTASAAGSSKLDLLSPQKVAITSGGALTTTIVVFNPGTAVPATFSIQANKTFLVSPASATLAADAVTSVSLTFIPTDPHTLTASGQLSVTANDAPTSVPFQLSAATQSSDWVLWTIFAPLVAAFVLLTVAWRTLSASKRPGVERRVGPVNWDFTQSFASNITVFSAVLGTILSAGVLPTDLPADRLAAYAGLNLLFGIAVIAGPFLYTALQKTELVNARGKQKEPQYQGFVWSFLVATIVTTWATAGEFVTIAKLFGDIGSGGTLPAPAVATFIALVVVAGLGLLVLIWRRSRAILTAQGDPARATDHKNIKRENLTALGIADLPDVHHFVPELDPWPAF